MKRKREWFRMLVLCIAGVLVFSGALADLTEQHREYHFTLEDIQGPEANAPGKTTDPETPAEVAENGDWMHDQNTVNLDGHLDLRWNRGTDRYDLLINGKAASWDQDIRSAVQFCIANGIRMDTFEDGNGYSMEQKILFLGNIQLEEYGFYVDQGASDMKGRLLSYRIYPAIREEQPDAIALQAQEILDKLQAECGSPTDKMRYFDDGKKAADIDGYDLYSAVHRMMDTVKEGHRFVVVQFRNLSLYVTASNGEISIQINLSRYTI